ncbi:hypothetical protein, partial [Enterococcus faecalis]|uniref:hypothetical protein n=1 Tax=Enterococcus faecalis TaxID=1351 RepID=UPI0022F06198
YDHNSTARMCENTGRHRIVNTSSSTPATVDAGRVSPRLASTRKPSITPSETFDDDDDDDGVRSSV